MKLEDALEERHTTWVMWKEPWPACGPEGNDLSAHVTMKMTVHDAVNVARHRAKSHGVTDLVGNDHDFLLDFMAVHWAELQPYKADE